MGLTTDLEKKWLYWLVRSYDGSELHKAPTADTIAPGVNEVCFFSVYYYKNLHTSTFLYFDQKRNVLKLPTNLRNTIESEWSVKCTPPIY